MKLLKILILFTLVLFPFGELLRVQLNNYVAIKPLDVVVGVTAFWWIIWKVKSFHVTFKVLKKSAFALPFIAFISVGFISLLISLSWLEASQFWVSLLYLFRFISYTLLFPIVLQFDKQFKKTIFIFLFIDGLILLALGYAQYFLFNNLKFLYYLGWDDHMHRMVSTFLDPNFAGAFFVLYLLFIGGMVIKYQGKSIKYKGFLTIVLLLTSLAVFLTFSRSALLALIVGGSSFFFLIRKRKFVFFLLAAIMLFGIAASPKFYDENMNLFREASSKARLENYAFALRVIQNHPIVGVGFNSYRYTKPLYGEDHDWVDAPSHADAGVDNSFLFVLATTGIIGFVAYGLMWANLLKRALYLHRKKVSGAVVVIASSFALFTNALFINSLFFAPLMLWIWMLWGLYEELKS